MLCRTEVTATFAAEQKLGVLRSLLCSLAREQKCARTDCDGGFRQAGESSTPHYLAGLVGV
ncbi:hypothetical protein EYF80_018105 [Liparis tanakae]|uniref:Uncharacterized protein n=1 Tax=Liparis tanakae TaxID=230148 RepID=A0A4Z2I361_9TELE|nr:hypothetical protein EYF80_018105 [Liparis tanakae]